MGIAILEGLLNEENYKKISKKIKIVQLKKKNYNEIEYIFCRLNKNLNKNFLNQFKKLKYIITPTTGTTHIYKTFPKKKIIKLIPEEIKNIKSTAEFNLTLILSASRKLFDYIDCTKKSFLNRYKFKTQSFKNLTVGIIGCGRIGSYLIKNLKILGFNVLYFDKEKKIGSTNLKKIMQNSDIISLNISSETKNYNFLDFHLMSLCKKKPILVNTSRGELIKDSDLFKALNRGLISEAYLDVISNEQKIILSKKYSKNLKKFIQSNKIKLTPHIGGSNLDAMIFTENLVLKKFLRKIKND